MPPLTGRLPATALHSASLLIPQIELCIEIRSEHQEANQHSGG